ncbi:MAG: DNA mismatch repair endonuclease MutL [Muribaculaceae bacterium]|nr:DNA mismatch repair endonuclease MutL [Muribaculaceae bacterium]
MNPDIIKVLPESVANQIKAGEVVHRPASVVKELVENAIDSGATSISIVVKDAGRTLVQVIDNGCGMSPADARMAFEHHATSKISSTDDMSRLHTMGFRGEALPSIVSVAQVELRTMRRGDEMATRLCMADSHFVSSEAVTGVPGTNIMVKNLFYNVPARRKFLKKDNVELGQIMREFERQALVNPGVDFTLISNDTTLHQLLHGTEKQRIIDIFGKSFDRSLLPVATASPFVRISGFIGLPSAAKKRGYQQFFFVNGRNMLHPMFHRAIMDCYAPLIASDARPSYFISFEVDPANIDVNVHPQKHEIKFEDEQAIREVLVAAVKESLGRFNVSGAMDFDMDDAPEIPAIDPRQPIVAPSDGDDSYNPFSIPAADNTQKTHSSRINTQDTPRGGTGERTHRPVTDWQKLYEQFAGERAAGLEEVRGSALNTVPEADGAAQPALPDMATSTAQTCLQLRNRYIAMPSATGLMLIDQHRAHVNVLYARLMAARGNGTIATQRLFFPDMVELTPAQSAALAGATDVAADMGFDIVRTEGNTWAVNGVPADIDKCRPADLLAAMADELAEGDSRKDPANIRSTAALALARSAAIRAGQLLGADEMEALTADLMRLPAPTYTPDGLRVIAVLDNATIDNLFQ